MLISNEPIGIQNFITLDLSGFAWAWQMEQNMK